MIAKRNSPLSNNLLYGFKHPSSLRSSARARAAGGARAHVSAPLGTAGRPLPGMRSEHVVAGAVGSTALGSHHGASLEDHGPNVVL